LFIAARLIWLPVIVREIGAPADEFITADVASHEVARTIDAGDVATPTNAAAKKIRPTVVLENDFM
jgi:hypothetical protein